ncbi:MAG: DUF4129 domain-containing protein [Deltaproteobacteria bacterium]|nr:DUF4129 domain-containing protein [Deltaproteobacteria bacterium]
MLHKLAAGLALAVLAVFCPVLQAPAAGIGTPFAAVNAEEAGKAAKDAERALGLQTSLPLKEKREPAPLPAPPERAWDLSLDKILLWGAVAVGLTILVLSLRGSRWSDSRSRRFAREDAVSPAPEESASRLDKVHGQAEDLAGRGDFAGAMHLLLLQSVRELRSRLDMAIAVSLTSREIARRASLSPEGRAAFAGIVTRVEISYFGGREPGHEEYLACREHFEALVQALRRAGLREGSR